MRTHRFVTSALHFSVLAVFCSGCIKNPALGLTPNDVDPVVEENGSNRERGLYRGEEKLDEQDFYSIVGDEKSTTAVKSSRSAGESKQTIGGVLIGVGASVLATSIVLLIAPKGGLLGDKGLYEPSVGAAYGSYI
ncbi:MAG TPA: hypothetical protein PK156_04990, partial [Polyangium sp.]|nr:hypothetical protein [Polyangium sp.]